MRIRTKLVLLLTGAVIVTMGLSTWLRVALTRRQLEAEADLRAHEVADDIKRALEALPQTADRTDYARILGSTLQQHRTLLSVELVMQEGPVQSRYTASPGKRSLITLGKPLRGVRTWEPLGVTRTQRVAGQRIVTMSVDVDPEGPLYGVLTTRTTLEPVDRMIKTQEFVSLEVTIGAIVLAMILIGFISERVVVRPLTLLGFAMADVERGNLSRRVHERPGRDEVARLANGFNRMIARLEQADAEIRAWSERLAAEVAEATRDLQEKNAALGQLNRLLVETRRELGDKERLAALGQLAAQLAHEIGTPLGSISGHLQLALGARDCPPPLRERLGVAIREVERVGKIVRDYLDSTRPAQPALLPARTERIIEEAIELARSANTDRAGIEIRRRVDPRVATLKTDPGLLRQILVNLITNALDAVGAASAGAVEVLAIPDGKCARVCVRDGGTGIASEDLVRIFEPFYTTKGRGKGTGLGLAICNVLPGALGGRISVESEPGKGSLFTVTLPLEADKPEKGARHSQSAA